MYTSYVVTLKIDGIEFQRFKRTSSKPTFGSVVVYGRDFSRVSWRGDGYTAERFAQGRRSKGEMAFSCPIGDGAHRFVATGVGVFGLVDIEAKVVGVREGRG